EVGAGAVQKKMDNGQESGAGPDMGKEDAARAEAGRPPAPRPRARVKTFSADVKLTPRLSVGTATPESIYEARFEGTIKAEHPGGLEGIGVGERVADDCELELPLPPQTISLADRSIKAGDKDGEKVALRDGKLVWRGPLKAEPTELHIKYTAVGKGLYELSVPPGGILDQFEIKLTAKGSDVRLLELSLQPTDLTRTADGT